MEWNKSKINKHYSNKLGPTTLNFSPIGLVPKRGRDLNRNMKLETFLTAHLDLLFNHLRNMVPIVIYIKYSCLVNLCPAD